ncbi:xin actin-binding repeat-containing protein 1 isoform X4 [Gouania willdenowi]|uniref:xin actin-binding repeat-containing protein 1 isoform X4 n=1 Tax=Gouania willdenowi TaxID=441366 RepID=UPI0010565EDA|nr:xin actin-binding repeat-containing protein 1-like isoform X4 [Gouania willdenowi]
MSRGTETDKRLKANYPLMMEGIKNMGCTQSLGNSPLSCDKAVWTDSGLRDKTKSVSQLVARYQTTVKASTFVQSPSVDHDKGKQGRVLEKVTQSPPERKENDLDSFMRTNKEKERSRIKETMIRSKSMSSLPSSPQAIGALRAMFESKASTQDGSKPSTRAANHTSQHVVNVSVKNIVTKEVQKTPERKQTNRDVNNENQTAAKEDQVKQNVINQTQFERRKTIGGIDFQMIATTQADEKRRSIADFRESSFIQTKEALSVSVKAMSALYLSKVAPQEKEQDSSGEHGKRGKPAKMTEGSTSQRQDGLPLAKEDISGVHPQQAMPFSRELLHQQRQKCELRRLLKHTHPELKKLEDVVDEELAEVLSLEVETPAETEYEGGVFSRCLKFESCGLDDKVSPYSPKMYLLQGKVEGCNIKRKSAVFQGPDEKSGTESAKEIAVDEKCLGYSSCLVKENEEEMLQIDVQRTRMIFENQSTKQLSPNQGNTIAGQDSSRESEPKSHPKQKQVELCSNKNLNKKFETTYLTHDQPDKQVSCTLDCGTENCVSRSEDEFIDEKEEFASIPDLAECVGSIKLHPDFSRNNPFVSKNIDSDICFVHKSKSETTATNCVAGEEKISANVKTRTHLFESMPFEKIRHQNQDEIEMMVENIKETLEFLYHVDAIHSSGSIIEVNETMIAKKAKFSLSENGPEIKYDEVTEGGAQNFILQLLPRVNLKPHITYLKENREKCIRSIVVNVPFHQRQFNATKDTECKTANVAQLVEDILNQDNSLRKGVIIQQDVNKSAEVIVYSLYKYIDEADVKSYFPLQGAEYNEPQLDNDSRNNTSNKDTRFINDPAMNRFVETPKDQICTGSLTLDISAKGNVKLVKNCIEKGDFEYLKTLQDEPISQEQEPNRNQTVASQSEEPCHENAEDSSSDWIPVNISELKRIFSEDRHKIQPKQNWGHAVAFRAASAGNRNPNTNSSTKFPCERFNTSRDCVSKAKTEELAKSVLLQKSCHENDDRVHQAELVEVVDDCNEISNLHNAIQELQYSTDAKSFYYSSQKEHTVLSQGSEVEPSVSVAANDDQKVESFTPSEQESMAGAFLGQNSSSCSTIKEPTADLCSKMNENTIEMVENPLSTNSVITNTIVAEQVDEEVVFEGTIKAALESLEKSNINVTKGDFRAAMIYRNSSKPHDKKPQITGCVSTQVPNTETLYSITETESNQIPKCEVIVGKENSLLETKAGTSAVSDKKRRPIGPKPVVPPKPEHLIVRQRNDQTLSTTNSEGFPTNALRTKERVHQDPQPLENSDETNYITRKEIKVTQETDLSPQAQASTSENKETERTNNHRQEEPDAPPGVQSKNNINETDESHVDFREACQKFGGRETLMKTAPVKPKRVKNAQPVKVTTDPLLGTGEQSDDKVKMQKEDCKVEMRGKKAKPETEDERRQRLSVHMDEIVRGNITTALEIFDNLRKQEELQSILSRVEEIEQDTSDVNVGSLRTVFQNVPEWVVSSDRNTQNKAKEESKGIKLQSPAHKPQNKTSMENVFGDLERASEEIMTLKEQTLARLMDIEEAIQKALYSVSTLKSDSDIAGLSCLFKESLGTAQGSSSSGNISTISIGSSRAKTEQAEESDRINLKTANAKTVSAKQKGSPPSSPAFISIQSAAKKKEKMDSGLLETTMCQTCQQSPKVEEKFRATKTLLCNSPAQNRKRVTQTNPNRELSVLEVQTNTDGKSILGTKTVKENYERTDNFGNRFYSTKTSTVVTTQPQTTISSPKQVVSSPASTQVTTFPEVQLVVNQMPK